jgi:ribosomal protein S18 acetylase RimI-like enzyme
MPGLRIEPFSDAHLDDAAALLEARHARHREAEPLLPADVDFRAQVEGEWRHEGASGVFASRGAEPAGYLVARPAPYGARPTPHEQMLSGIAGHAVSGDRELARDLYTAAAGPWVEAGYLRHMVFVPACDTELVDAWFRLSFGASAALATRETSAEPPHDAGVEIRRSTPGDLEAAARLERAMHDSMVPSPSFSTGGFTTDAEYVDDWRDTWEQPQFTHFVAERDGRIVGHALLYKRPHDLRVPKDSIDLAGASTFPDDRGGGVGRALTAHVIAWAHEHGYPTMVTDWRMTNMLASRFWPKRGFRETFLRLYRALP